MMGSAWLAKLIVHDAIDVMNLKDGEAVYRTRDYAQTHLTSLVLRFLVLWNMQFYNKKKYGCQIIFPIPNFTMLRTCRELKDLFNHLCMSMLQLTNKKYSGTFSMTKKFKYYYLLKMV